MEEKAPRYTPEVYEELQHLVNDLVAHNAAGLEEDIETLKILLFEAKPKVICLIKLLSREGECPPKEAEVSILRDPADEPDAPSLRMSVPVGASLKEKVSSYLKKRDATTLTTPRSSPFEGLKCKQQPEPTPQPTPQPMSMPSCGRRLEADSNTGDNGMLGYPGRCSCSVRQVKIWFQNRRMKWKRSKKAQQEAKSTKDCEKSHSPVSNSHNNTKPSSSQEPSSSTCSSGSQGCLDTPRKMSGDSEQLYRPYVV